MLANRLVSSCCSKLFANCSQSFNRLNLKPKLIPYSEDRSYASFSIAAPSSSSSIRNRRRNPGMHGEKVWTSWVSAGLFVWHPVRAREIPVLLRRYNELGRVLLDFKVDPALSNALDGWMDRPLSDKTDPALPRSGAKWTYAMRSARSYHSLRQILTKPLPYTIA